MTDQSRIPILAAGRSIYACAKRLFPPKYSQFLYPHLLPNGEISLGDTLIFKDHQFCNILEKGYGFPQVCSLLFAPYRSLRTLSCLWEVGKLYKSDNRKDYCILLLLGGGLEAICTYLNFHEKAHRIFEAENEYCLSVIIKGTDQKYVVFHQQHSGWSVKLVEKTFSTSASLTFNCPETARNASLGQLDSWFALTSGEILLAGRIPFLDKFGYVARIVQQQVPMPK